MSLNPARGAFVSLPFHLWLQCRMVGITAKLSGFDAHCVSFVLQDFKYGRELARLMQEAGQHVPPELANCGPGFGGGRGGGSRYGPPGA